MVQAFEIIPPPSTQPWVERIWSISGDTSDDPTPMRQILPDGSVEIIFRLAGSATQIAGVRQTPFSSACVVGQLRAPLSIRLGGMLDWVGVRCRPTGAAAILGIPMHELSDRVTSLDEIGINLHTDRLAECSDMRAKLSMVNSWVHQRLADAIERCPIRYATETILATGGRMSVRQVACETGMSERQLERRFQSLVGVSPKSLARITRFARAFNLAQTSAKPDWCRFAARAGYFDQAHLCRDFSLLGGGSPEQMRSDTSVDRWCSNLDFDRFSADLSAFSNTRALRCA